MNDQARARVAAVVAAAARQTRVTSVYDYSVGGYRRASAEITSGRVRGYDFDSGTHLTGGGNALDFYDYATARHVTLRLEGSLFRGYDYASRRHFTGTVRGRAISLYDYETGQYHSYSA